MYIHSRLPHVAPKNKMKIPWNICYYSLIVGCKRLGPTWFSVSIGRENIFYLVISESVTLPIDCVTWRKDWFHFLRKIPARYCVKRQLLTQVEKRVFHLRYTLEIRSHHVRIPRIRRVVRKISVAAGYSIYKLHRSSGTQKNSSKHSVILNHAWAMSYCQ